MKFDCRDPPLADRDFAIKRGREPEDQTALQLRHDRIGIDRDAGIDGCGDAAQMNFAGIVDVGFNDGGYKAAERWLYAHAASGARRQRGAPIGFLRHQIERRLEPRISAEHAAAEFNRVLAGLVRQFVHEALGGKDVVVRSNAAPETGGHGGRLRAHILHLPVRNIVRHVDGAIDRIDVDAVDEY